VVRMIEPGLTDGMVEFATLAVLAIHRDWPAYAAQQRERRWQALPVRTAVSRRVGVLGMGVLGQAVAAKLQAHTGNWSNAWQILRRLHAYELTPDVGMDYDVIARLAAVETALVECAQRGAGEIVVGDGVPDHVLDRINPIEGVRFVRASEPATPGVRRAYCGVGEPDPAIAVDLACDIVPVMDRFPVFA